MLKKFLFLLAIAFPLIASADNVPYGKAKEIADVFFNQGVPTRAFTPLTMVSDDGVYIFRSSEGRFLIVSGDDVVEPILGYFTSDVNDMQDMPDNFKWWISELKGGIKYLKEKGVKQSPKVKSLWLSAAAPTKAGKGKAKLLETAQWGQDEPFNSLCPKVYGTATLTGCVATSAAIIMRYYKWPQRGTGKIEPYAFPGGTIAGYDLGHEYKWDLMPLSMSSSSSPEQIAQVSQLMYDCATMAQAQFGTQGTAASNQKLYAKMIEQMDYDASAVFYRRSDFSSDTWVDMICSHIDNIGPVWFSGIAKDGSGHSFILDGYDADGKIHINWGWSGYQDGYFAFPDFDEYTQNQDAIFNLQPNKGGKPVDIIELVTYGSMNGLIPIDPATIELNKPFNITVSGVSNRGITSFEGEIALATVTSEGIFKEKIGVLNLGNQEFKPNITFISVVIPCTITKKIEEGETIRLFYKGKNMEDWKEVYCGEDVVSQFPIYYLHIDKETSFAYSDVSKEITITTILGISVKMTDLRGSEVLDGIVYSDKGQNRVITINTKELSDGIYTITLGKGEFEKSFKFAIGKK